MIDDAAWLDVTGRVCVVTGAASGIGAEAARQLAAAGAHVAILDRDRKGAMTLAAEIAGTGGRAIGIEADVACVEQIQTAADSVKRELGACRILVNNAAVLSAHGLMDVNLEAWSDQIAVNLTGALLCTQAFARQMIDHGQGGSIINVTSITGQQPMAFGGAYSVSKAALSMLTRVLTMELASHRIRSNAVAPALVRTPLSEAAYSNPEIARKREEMVPIGRISSPCDIANVILFLASDRSSYINGQEVLVDGGLTQTLMGMIPRPK
ncbi:NAD(P)-dependent dehydrogenase, short-chain alcohol dehydrogenase family [Burkholderia sp. YR290]|nr:NAD(P)-dependent dehydrogenase, short-chain alcohol dehydrogenase family [Burkholderia sp. YR290]